MSYKTIILLLSTTFILQACATKSKTAQVVTVSPTPIVKADAIESAKPPLSPKLFTLLKSSGIKIKKVDHAEVIKAFDVLCKVTLPEGNRICTFTSGAKKYKVPVKQSDEMSDLLFGLNLYQGDSGVSASYIECNKFEGDSDVNCEVAMPLDYQKP